MKRMGRFSLSLWLAALSFTVGFAQDKHCLWKVQGDNAPIYLLGSVHVLSEAQYPLAQVIEDAYTASSQIFFEMNLDSVTTPKAAALMMSKIQLPEGHTLRSLLDNATWQRLQKATGDLGISIDGFKNCQPWFVASNLMMTALGRHGFNPTYGLDMYFFQQSKRDGKTIKGLETLAFQLDLFSELGDSLQSAFIAQTLDELQLIETAFGRIVRHWETGQIDSLEALLLEGFSEEPEFYEAFLKKRNVAWLPEIETLLKSDIPTLVVVGTAHLVGKDGVVAMLRDKGVSVEQL
ncbi:TraB/GumN family protein [bacterium]|nr:TraB/GumN family protein [bacterium]